MTVDTLRQENRIVFDAVSGSRAYGTNTPTSDTDLKGVFVLPAERFYGFDPPVQVNDTDDITYYELGRFFELLAKNNPTALELLATPDDCVRLRHALLTDVRPELFLSRLCEQAFAGYAMTQVRKARGLNKKIANPQPEQRRDARDFCHILTGQGSTPLDQWLTDTGFAETDCGLVNAPHARDVYAVFHDPTSHYRGIFKSDDASELRCSSIPRGQEPVAWLVYNRDAFARHCREHTEYWEWVAKRNPARYADTTNHGRNYDGKNLMHTFRLLAMAEEVATLGKLIVRRPPEHVDFLLSIRRGEHTYEDLLTRAEDTIGKIADLYKASDLPAAPDRQAVETLLIKLRIQFYQNT